MSVARKIPRGQLKTFTIQLLKRDQDMCCAICKKPIDLKVRGNKSDYVVDHNHETGAIRGILHRSCNSAEGKVLKAAGSWGAKDCSIGASIAWLKAMLEYHEHHEANPSPYIYPAHKTEAEKLLIAKKKRREADARRRAKARQEQIKLQRESETYDQTDI